MNIGRKNQFLLPLLRSTVDERGNPVEEVKSSEYTDEMQKRMGGSLTYNHEDGMNFDYILPDLIVGSCPQSAFDVDRLVEEGVGAIFCLQEDHDAQYFGFEIEDIQLRCEERGDIVHVRCPVRDFDPFNLRLKLPTAVAKLHAAQRLAGGKSVYVHCTAGLGRAPGAALAYMFWMRGFDLTEAYNLLMEKRPCHPKLEAIRAATCDILFESSRTPCEILVSRFGTCSSIQVSGLDVGWGQFLDLGYDPARRAFCLRRELLPGKYPYKLVWDGHWSYSGARRRRGPSPSPLLSRARAMSVNLGAGVCTNPSVPRDVGEAPRRTSEGAARGFPFQTGISSSPPFLLLCGSRARRSFGAPSPPETERRSVRPVP